MAGEFNMAVKVSQAGAAYLVGRQMQKDRDRRKHQHERALKYERTYYERHKKSK